MKSINDIMQKRADTLDLDRQDTLKAAQTLLSELYPGKARARSVQDGLLSITTPSATVANDLRLRQVEILERLNKLPITRIKISIG